MFSFVLYRTGMPVSLREYQVLFVAGLLLSSRVSVLAISYEEAGMQLAC